MKASLSNAAFGLFKKYIHDKCGINIGEEKAYLIETRLSKLLVDAQVSSFEALYHKIVKEDDASMAVKVIDAITTNETLWFRDKTPWLILEELLLPKYIEKLRMGEKQRIRIWSAAASTGQEAYSTAMCIDRYLEKNAIKDITLSHFQIIATDISNTVLEIAKKGRYDAVSMIRGMAPEYKDRYFTKQGMAWKIDDKIKNAITFKSFNLQNSFVFLGQFDVIFFRYVLIYFANILREEIFNKLSTTIEKEGTLIIGASEIYHQLDLFFDMKHHTQGTYYMRRETNEGTYSR